MGRSSPWARLFFFALTHGDASGFWHYLLLAVAASLVVGAVVERVFIRRVLNRAEHYQILLTYALLLIIEDVSEYLLRRRLQVHRHAQGIRNASVRAGH